MHRSQSHDQSGRPSQKISHTLIHIKDVIPSANGGGWHRNQEEGEFGWRQFMIAGGTRKRNP